VKMIGGGRPLLRENSADTDPPPLQNADFQSIFPRITSVVMQRGLSAIVELLVYIEKDIQH